MIRAQKKAAVPAKGERLYFLADIIGTDKAAYGGET
jgi:hypothetical protein